jgi:hypothetical protein
LGIIRRYAPLLEERLSPDFLSQNFGFKSFPLPLPSRKWHGFGICGTKFFTVLGYSGQKRAGLTAKVQATLAQLVEQLICNQQVVGSIPTSGSGFGARKREMKRR